MSRIDFEYVILALVVGIWAAAAAWRALRGKPTVVIGGRCHQKWDWGHEPNRVRLHMPAGRAATGWLRRDSEQEAEQGRAGHVDKVRQLKPRESR